jgi:hypothetical protein
MILSLLYKRTLLSAGGAECSRSFVSACNGTVPQSCEPVLPRPVGLSHPHSPVLM